MAPNFSHNARMDHKFLTFWVIKSHMIFSNITISRIFLVATRQKFKCADLLSAFIQGNQISSIFTWFLSDDGKLNFYMHFLDYLAAVATLRSSIVWTVSTIVVHRYSIVFSWNALTASSLAELHSTSSWYFLLPSKRILR